MHVRAPLRLADDLIHHTSELAGVYHLCINDTPEAANPRKSISHTSREIAATSQFNTLR